METYIYPYETTSFQYKMYQNDVVFVKLEKKIELSDDETDCTVGFVS